MTKLEGRVQKAYDIWKKRNTKTERQRKKRNELNKHSKKQVPNEEDHSTKHEDNKKEEPDTKTVEKRIKNMNEEE